MKFWQVVMASAFVVVLSTARAEAEDASPSDGIWTEPSGQSVGIGFGNGIWGGLYAQDLRGRIPFGDHLALQLRMLALSAVQSDPYRMDLGGRIGIQGGSKPLLNILRIYGAGGIQLAAPITGVDQKDLHVGFGGEFGLEAFMFNTISIFLEVGGNGFIDSSYGAGGVVMAGMNFYPF